MKNNLIQIAGVKNVTEARLLLDAGVDMIGYPLRLPVNKADTTEAEARQIIQNSQSRNRSVLITYMSKADEIVKFCKYLGVKIVQLHGNIRYRELEKIKKNVPDLQIIKSLVIGLMDEDEIERTIHYTYPYVDYYITDTYNPVTGASGATGKTHDWSISREIVDLSPKPVILAGGLTPYNVYDAIHAVRPAGVDAHTGVEDTQGNKDPRLVREFVSNARKGFSELTDNNEPIKPEHSDTLDLHNFHPRDVKSLVNEFILDCSRRHLQKVRIIHGKGKGVLREIVHRELEKNEMVRSFKLANDRFSSWGATIVTLRKIVSDKMSGL
ncbi:MAG: Smr/MutS family protein [Fidelibacterota bacterium]